MNSDDDRYGFGRSHPPPGLPQGGFASGPRRPCRSGAKGSSRLKPETRRLMLAAGSEMLASIRRLTEVAELAWHEWMAPGLHEGPRADALGTDLDDAREHAPTGEHDVDPFEIVISNLDSTGQEATP